MEFGYLSAPAGIAHAVKAVWFARGSKADFDHADPIAPDGCVEIVLNFGDPFVEEARGRRVAQPRDLLVGQMTRPTTATPTGTVDLLGIRFWPGRAGAVLRTPMWELQNRLARVSDILGGTDRWIDDLGGVRRGDRLGLLSSRLAARCRGVDPDRLRLVEGVLTRIVGGRGNVSIERLAGEAGVSRRHLERLFREQVGLAAKQVARIARVHAALRAIETDASAGGASIAARCGFTDQAHLIRECHAIAGVTPARIRTGLNSLAGLMRAPDGGSPGGASPS